MIFAIGLAWQLYSHSMRHWYGRYHVAHTYLVGTGTSVAGALFR